MKKTLIAFALTAAVFTACNLRGDSDPDSDDKDTINAGKANENIIQNELNKDTSSNSPGDADTASTRRDTGITNQP
ncbi:hypothetical protein [Desertivirga brevis]|uniref:hypothetical protein n=1 Tax=Desertivirga brevis TaxID=2810310 RepID=UPI001A959508|nr:hypothetical protein [Pedobacter sp. SYSU D00873]